MRDALDTDLSKYFIYMRSWGGGGGEGKENREVVQKEQEEQEEQEKDKEDEVEGEKERSVTGGGVEGAGVRAGEASVYCQLEENQ